jgi:hypothetical protein
MILAWLCRCICGFGGCSTPVAIQRLKKRAKISAITANLVDDRSQAYSRAGVILLRTLAPGNLSNEACEDLCRVALGCASRINDVFLQGWLRWVIAWFEIVVGRITRARDLAQELMAVGHKLNDPRSAGLGFRVSTVTVRL